MKLTQRQDDGDTRETQDGFPEDRAGDMKDANAIKEADAVKDANVAKDVKDMKGTAADSASAVAGESGDGQAAERAEDERGKEPRRFHIPAWGYALLFVLFDFVTVLMLQWGVTQGSTRVQLSSPLDGVWDLVAKMWTKGNFVIVLNMLLLGLIYLALIMLFNRFWVATPLLLAAAVFVAVVEHFKVSLRYETVSPSDFDFLSSGNAGSLIGFIPSGSGPLIAVSVVAIIAIVALFWAVAHFDARHGKVFSMSGRQGKSVGAVSRILLVVAPLLLFAGYGASVSGVNTFTNSFAKALGDIPSMWDSVYDAQRNGPLVSFMGQVNPHVMDEPADYSEATMRQVAKRYAGEARRINRTRTSNLDDGTVIFVLSESYSDPTRVPGVKVNHDPMPGIRSVKEGTTSGLMLSSGYGGGTANLEYMSLTGLSMANFDPSLTSPYQQLVPGERWTPTVNQMWGDKSNSVAFHPYEPSMYSRASNYKKFGISHFYTLEPPDVIAHQGKLGKSPYVSDQSTYQSVLDEVSKTKSNQFVQVATMQNHMPYHGWYPGNTFKATSSDPSKPLKSDENESIDTYAKGVNLTDKATTKFLSKLDALGKPVTVVFYGDHLPGIYSTASADQDNSLALHETDYFIWSNKASGRQGAKAQGAAYSSPNFFMAQTAEHDNAKVSPYLAFLTDLHGKVSAIEPPVVNKIQGWDRIPEGQPIYLDAKGHPMAAKDFDAKTKRLMHDYQLIQYDITAGKGYLQDTDFMRAK